MCFVDFVSSFDVHLLKFRIFLQSEHFQLFWWLMEEFSYVVNRRFCIFWRLSISFVSVWAGIFYANSGHKKSIRQWELKDSFSSKYWVQFLPEFWRRTLLRFFSRDCDRKVELNFFLIQLLLNLADEVEFLSLCCSVISSIFLPLNISTIFQYVCRHFIVSWNGQWLYIFIIRHIHDYLLECGVDYLLVGALQ